MRDVTNINKNYKRRRNRQYYKCVFFTSYSKTTPNGHFGLFCNCYQVFCVIFLHQTFFQLEYHNHFFPNHLNNIQLNHHYKNTWLKIKQSILKVWLFTIGIWFPNFSRNFRMQFIFLIKIDLGDWGRSSFWLF